MTGYIALAVMALGLYSPVFLAGGFALGWWYRGRKDAPQETSDE